MTAKDDEMILKTAKEIIVYQTVDATVKAAARPPYHKEVPETANQKATLKK